MWEIVGYLCNVPLRLKAAVRPSGMRDLSTSMSMVWLAESIDESVSKLGTSGSKVKGDTTYDRRPQSIPKVEVTSLVN